MKFLGRVASLFIAGVSLATAIPSEEKPQRRLGSRGKDAPNFIPDARATEATSNAPPSGVGVGKTKWIDESEWNKKNEPEVGFPVGRNLFRVSSAGESNARAGLRVSIVDDNVRSVFGDKKKSLNDFPHLQDASNAGLKYNQVRMKSSHNSYERSESYSDQLYYYRIRSLEIDIYRDSESGRWRVYHSWLQQGSSTVRNLRDVIKIFSEFQKQVPNHEVVTVWVDAKQDFTDTHKTEEFDSIIQQLHLYTPDEAAGSSDSIKDGIIANGWPEMQALKGKFIFVVTDGQDSYCTTDESCRQRKAFITLRSTDDSNDIGRHSWIVFYNQNVDAGLDMGPRIHNEGFVSRVYDTFDINSSQDWNEASQNMFNHIATNQVNVHTDTYARTTNARGYPFESLDGSIDVSQSTEDMNSLYFHYDNGNTWGQYDDMAFAYHENSDMDVIYTASIATPNSHCDDWAKSGIMVRENITSGEWNSESSPYFAVMRLCENNKLRVQYRSNFNEDTIRVEAPDFDGDGIKEVDRLHVKLVYRRSSSGVRVDGYFKPSDTAEYILIGGHSFGGKELRYQGLFGSSHGDSGFPDGTKIGSTFVNFEKNGSIMRSDQFRVILVGNDNCTPTYFGDDFAPLTMPCLLPSGSSCLTDAQCLSGDCKCAGFICTSWWIYGWKCA